LAIALQNKRNPAHNTQYTHMTLGNTAQADQGSTQKINFEQYARIQ
jgi:hypothetical protein